MIRKEQLKKLMKRKMRFIKDHEIAQAINELRDIAIKYHAAQQLREKIAGVILRLCKEPQPGT